MKLNIFMLIIAIIVGCLVFYLFFTATEKLLLPSIATVLSVTTLLLAGGINFEDNSRSIFIFRMLALILFLVSGLTNIGFLWFSASDIVIITVNGIVSIIGAIGLYLIYKSEQ